MPDDDHTTPNITPANDNAHDRAGISELNAHSSDIQADGPNVQSEAEYSSIRLMLKPLAIALGKQAAREWIAAHTAANDNDADPALCGTKSINDEADTNAPSKDTN